MEQKFLPSAPSLSSFSSIGVESMINEHLAKKICFNNSIQNIKMMMKFYKMQEKSIVVNTRNPSCFVI